MGDTLSETPLPDQVEGVPAEPLSDETTTTEDATPGEYELDKSDWRHPDNAETAP